MNGMINGTSHATSSIKPEEGNEGGPDVVRISSPGLSGAVQSLSLVTKA